MVTGSTYRVVQMTRTLTAHGLKPVEPTARGLQLTANAKIIVNATKGDDITVNANKNWLMLPFPCDWASLVSVGQETNTVLLYYISTSCTRPS